MIEMPLPVTKRSEKSERWVPLPPDPAVLNAIGGGHTLESGIADIIDNSIDARASHVRVRLLTRDDELVGIRITDDGAGMTLSQLKGALRLGNRREYSGSDIGHFGIGLKAASMSNAEVLTVYTSSISNFSIEYAAMELSFELSDSEIGARVLSPERAKSGYNFGESESPPQLGTVVEWAGMKGASASVSVGERREWLDSKVSSIRNVLGLVFHRLIAQGDLRIELDILDIDSHSSGVPRSIGPLDPFSYHIPGKTGFPLEIGNSLFDGTLITATCHLLPAKGVDKLPGRKEDWQGLYIYRNNRLLTFQAGWQGIAVSRNELRLARVEINITDSLFRYVVPTPEKNGVTLDPDFARALSTASNDGRSLTFTDYLEECVETWKASSRRSTEKPVTEISLGLPLPLIKEIDESFGWRGNKSPISIQCQALNAENLFKVDLARRALLINDRYSDAFGGHGTPAYNAFATLLYLLTETYFTRDSHLRTSTLDYLDRINNVLLTAVKRHETEISPSGQRVRSTPASALAAILSASRTEPVVRESGLDQASTYTIARTSVHINKDIAKNSPSRADLLKTPSHSVSGLPTTSLSTQDVEFFDMYSNGSTPSQIALDIGVPEREVVTSLTKAFFGNEATSDDQHLAPQHGIPYSPDIRERILHLFKNGKGSSVLEIANHVGRTPLAIAWRLLESPKRPIPLDKRIKKSVRRRSRD